MTKSKIFANLSWVGPERPYGKIDHYQIVLSSAKTVILTGSTTLDVKVIFKGRQHPLLVIYVHVPTEEYFYAHRIRLLLWIWHSGWRLTLSQILSRMNTLTFL